ncbi:MAG: hypothetical protein PHI12_06915 [Dehalococcoidales bacterium]|nr:hypothetical protein [Dehalococcoidales bacterium]
MKESSRPPLDELVSLKQATVVYEGVTTAPGAAGGNSLIDAGLIGFGANTFRSFVIQINPAFPNLVDAAVATAFNNATGEITVDVNFKGGQVLAGIAYKVITPSPTSTTIVADLGVPAPDGIINILERDAIGNKTDTGITASTNTASIIRYLKGIMDTLLGYEGVTPLANKLTAARAGYLDSLPNTQHETEWVVGSTIEQVSSAAATNLTASSVTPTFPAGSTRVRAILIASIHAANQSANTHNVSLKVQGQKAAGGYTDLLDLTTQTSLGMVNLIGASDGISLAIDVTAKVDASAVQYDFRFVVDSDNANAVNYTQNFVLVLVYTI